MLKHVIIVIVSTLRTIIALKVPTRKIPSDFSKEEQTKFSFPINMVTTKETTFFLFHFANHIHLCFPQPKIINTSSFCKQNWVIINF